MRKDREKHADAMTLVVMGQGTTTPFILLADPVGFGPMPEWNSFIYQDRKFEPGYA